MPDEIKPAPRAKPTPRIRKPKVATKTSVPITLYGAIPRQIVPVRSSSMMLLTAYGEKEDGEDVMVPLLDFQLFRASANGEDEKADGVDDQNADAALISMILTLENASYLFSDMAGDMQRAVAVLANQCGGGIKPDEQRIRYSAQSLRKAASRLEEAAGLLENDCLIS